MAPDARVFVTGLGAVTPLGMGAPATWEALLAGRTGVRRLEYPWIAEREFRTKVGAPVAPYDLTALGFPARDVKSLDPTCWHALAATREALLDAGFHLLPAEEGREAAFHVGGLDRDRTATIVGSGQGGITTLETVHEQWVRHGHFRGKGWMRFGLPMLIPNAPAANTAIRFGLRGECQAHATACAAGAMAIGAAFRIVRDGEADVAVAGGAEGALTDHDGLGFVGFDVLRVMSARNDEPDRASRPFDADRDGFVLGEGAAILVLEEERHARARGARLLAEVVSYASTCDASSMMQPDPSGARVVAALRQAVERAGVTPADVGYVNAHGTSTPLGDRVEAAALRTVFGSGSGAPLVSSTKSMTGHCIGASGAVEALATVLSLAEGKVHATRNLDRVDPECELRHVIGAPAEVRGLDLALSASYGFGGHDAVLAFRKA